MDERTIQIPGWKIIRTIGKGSFGTVYEVEKKDQFGSGIRSALKVISIPESSAELEAYRDDGYDEASLTKLYQSRVEAITAEFQLMNKLKGCSNIVSYEDHMIVQHENDPGYDIFIRMELLTPLPKYFERRFPDNRADEQTVRRLGADICRALELCARHGIIHRDIKPQNIFVNDNGDFKLGDFGVAKTADHTTKATKTGTYGYMAPEVYLGRPYHHEADLYSLGLVLYWMLNERRGPFVPQPPTVPTPNQISEALERRMRGEELPAPKHGSEALKRIVLKACAFDPKDRFQTPEQLKRALEDAVGADEPPYDKTIGILRDKPVYCRRCGARMRPGTNFCPACGAEQVSPAAPNGEAPRSDTNKEPDNGGNALPERPEGDSLPNGAEKTGKRGKKQWVILAIVAILMMAAAAAMTVLLLNSCGGKEDPAPVPVTQPATEPPATEPATEPTTPSAPPTTPPPTTPPTVPPTTPPPTTPPTLPPTTPPPTTPPYSEFYFGGAKISSGTTTIDGSARKINGTDSAPTHITREEVEMLVRLCPDLRTLDLDYCWFDTYEPLAKLTKLEHLELKSCGTDNGGVKITDIGWVRSLENMKELNLCHNRISDLDPLQNLTKLEILQLGDNQIGDSELETIGGLTNLEQLFLYKNRITDVSPLNNLRKLWLLNLGNNNISSVEALTGLPKLEDLRIYRTKISDLSCFPAFQALETVDLAACPLDYDDYWQLLNCNTLKLFKINQDDYEGISAGNDFQYYEYSLRYEIVNR